MAPITRSQANSQANPPGGDGFGGNFNGNQAQQHVDDNFDTPMDDATQESHGPDSQGPTGQNPPQSTGPDSQGPTGQNPSQSTGPDSQGPTGKNPPQSTGPDSQGPTGQNPPQSTGPDSQGPTGQNPSQSTGPDSQGPTGQNPLQPAGPNASSINIPGQTTWRLFEGYPLEARIDDFGLGLTDGSRSGQTTDMIYRHYPPAANWGDNNFKDWNTIVLRKDPDRPREKNVRGKILCTIEFRSLMAVMLPSLRSDTQHLGRVVLVGSEYSVERRKFTAAGGRHLPRVDPNIKFPKRAWKQKFIPIWAAEFERELAYIYGYLRDDDEDFPEEFIPDEANTPRHTRISRTGMCLSKSLMDSKLGRKATNSYSNALRFSVGQGSLHRRNGSTQGDEAYEDFLQRRLKDNDLRWFFSALA